jgi:hypothetical protein
MWTFHSDLTLTLFNIGFAIIILAMLIGALVFFWHAKINKKNLLYSLIGSIGITFLSAFIFSFKYQSGTGYTRKFGWPHYLYIKWLDFDGITSASGWYLGVGFSYVLVNIIFWGLVSLLLLLLTNKNKNQRSHY